MVKRVPPSDPNSSVYSALFGIESTTDGTADLSFLNGLPGTLGDGMSFAYTGENMWMDELWAAAQATRYLLNPGDGNGHAISCEIPLRRTIACSFEFGGLQDGTAPSTRMELLQRYMAFFRLR